MMPRRSAVLAWLLLVMLPLATAAAQDGRRLRIACYNVENLFDVFDDPYTQDERTDVKPREQVEALAAAIRRVDADVVALCEVEQEGLLRAMVYEFLPQMGYEYIAAGDTNSAHGIRLGVISRYPIARLASYRFRRLRLEGDPRTWRFARDLTHATIQLKDGLSLELFAAHFKSKLDSADDPQSAHWRLAEATAARQIIDELLNQNPQALVALVGDLNDSPDSPPLSKLLAGGRLIDAHASLPASQRITYLRKPFRGTIDYILVSPALAAKQVPGSARVLDDPALLAGSDHAPIVAEFDLGTER